MPTPLSQLRKIRLEKLAKIKKLGINPYPARSQRKQTCAEAVKMLGKTVSVAGRIMSIRGHGGIQFFDLVDQSGKIQLVFKKEDLLKKHLELLDLLDSGDFIDAQGKVFRTKAGEISVQVKAFRLLSKSIRPLPDKWHGLKDVEERYRRRYLDLILNPEARRILKTRSRLVSLIRHYFHEQKFIEVETPTFQAIYGGTNAKPFKTHVNALGQDMYLRIADELYLKRLVVGGFEKVYEICKDFRNEGLDLAHQPEFTMIEYYQAYADYQDMMKLTEDLIKFCAQKIFGELVMPVGKTKVSLAGKWPQITMKTAVKKYLKIDFDQTTPAKLIALLKKNKVRLTGRENKEELFFRVFDHFVPENLIKPTWVIDYPAAVSPLSKAKADDPVWVERFEGYIGGKEICDGWSEINSPLAQKERFEADQDKDEAHPIDHDFIEALEYGMPPLGGIGIGVDRLTMFFTNAWSIKEVILFPLMKRKNAAK